MMTRAIAAMLTLAALGGVTAASASAAGGPAFGGHVSSCAREHLGARSAPPTVTCTMPDGTSMAFPTFGAMVRHMHALR